MNASFVKRGRPAFLGLAALFAVGVHAQGSPMKTFALIFRVNPGRLSEADLQRRAEAVSAWARAQNEAGHKLDPRSLGPESVWTGPGRQRGKAAVPADGPLTTILFVEAASFEAATQLAESHPGLDFGASVEIRPWSPPQPPR